MAKNKKDNKADMMIRMGRALCHIRIETSTPHINLFDVDVGTKVITLMGKDEIRFDDKEKAEKMLCVRFPKYLVNWFEDGLR